MSMEPVIKQPGQQGGYGPPPGQFGGGVTPGLEYLAQIDQLLVQQKIEICELLTGCEMQNKYVIKNSVGQEVYHVKEDSDCCERIWCGPARSLNLPILDTQGREVMRFTRPLRCISMGCGCCYGRGCLQEIKVWAPPGNLIGIVYENANCCVPDLTICNGQEQPIFKLEGPTCACNWCSDVDFPVTTLDGQQVGRVQKQWSGFCREAFTDADKFNVSFPIDLDVNMKAVLLATLFLVDYMYFEQHQNNNN